MHHLDNSRSQRVLWLLGETGSLNKTRPKLMDFLKRIRGRDT